MSIYDLTNPIRTLIESEIGFTTIRAGGRVPLDAELYKFKAMRDQATTDLEAELDKYIDARVESILARRDTN